LYHVVVSAGASPAIDKTADVAVDSVDVGSCTVNVVHETRYSLTFRRQSIDLYCTGLSQLITVGVVTSQIHQEISVVPFLQFADKEPPRRIAI